MDRIFSDEAYREYYGYYRDYKVSGFEQIPLEDNVPLQQTIEAVKRQISGEYKNLANSMGFAIRGADGRITYSPLMEFYRSTMDGAVMDIVSGAFSYNQVLSRTIKKMTDSGVRWIDYDSGHHNRIDVAARRAIMTGFRQVQGKINEQVRTIKKMTDSGVRWIDYDSGHHNRIDVAARRAIMTGFRQVQGKINEQVAKDLGTDSYEVTYHVGARPEHQKWQGRVWTMEQLQSVCGLGTVTGLKGANCYHDYNAFIPGISVRSYTDKQLEQMMKEENIPKTYNGKQYTTYEALQQQRRMETAMRKSRQDIKLLQEGGADEMEVMLKKAKYQGQMQKYREFSKAMGLPEQMKRVYQDGLRGKFTPTKTELKKIEPPILKNAAGKDIIEVKRVTLTGNPNSITQLTGKKGGIERNYYDENGRQYKQISNNDHGNAKRHPYGNRGEHAHDYVYKDDKLIDRPARELTENERKENLDIL